MTVFAATGSAARTPRPAAGSSPAALLAGPPQAPAPPTTAAQPRHRQAATAVGRGGAVSTVDPEATRAGLRVLRRGGNAVDAAVAAAATLGVTEPYSAGIGGGGFFVVLRRRVRKVRTIDGRETAPKATTADTYRGLTLRRGGQQRPVGRRARHAARTGPGAAPVGHPEPRARRSRRPTGSPAAASSSTRPSATRPRPTRPGSATSRRPATLFLPGGQLPAVGSVFRNPDLADTYDTARPQGRRLALRRQARPRDRAAPSRQPPKDPAATRNVRPGLMTREDLAGYTAPSPASRPASATAG